MAGIEISDQYSPERILCFVSTVEYPAGAAKNSSPETLRDRAEEQEVGFTSSNRPGPYPERKAAA
jgi:hypothetical protein